MKQGLLFLQFLFISVCLSAQNTDNSQPGDIVINEVMADPVSLTALPETEYVEIYNVSGSDLSLLGWVFLYDGREAVLPDTVLPAGCYAVLYRSGRDMAVAGGALSLGIDKFPSSLANTGKTVGLKNSGGVLIDEVVYPKATKGKSHERDNENIWYLCTDEKGGTPGEANSPALPSEPEPNPEPDPEPDPGTDPDPTPDPVLPPLDNSQPGDIIINEVMADPVGLAALPETEYVEIYNVSGSDLSLSGWVFLYDGKETVLPDTVLPAGCYAVLYRSGREMAVAEGALSLGIDKFPSSLANTGKTVGLKNSKGILINEMTYPRAVKGKSYERDGRGLWHLCSDEKGGTPGKTNSPALLPDPDPDPDPAPGKNPDPTPDPVLPSSDNSRPGDIIINEVMADPVGLTALPETEYVEIYNVSGSNLSLSGWVFLYDGKETVLPGVVLPSGCYAVLYRSGRDISVAGGALSLGIDKFPSSLANTGKTVGLKNSKGILINEMTYPKAVRGKSYERDGRGLWHLCTDEKGGTPGKANSPALPPKPDPEPDPGTNPDPTPDPIIPPSDNSRPGDVVINEVMADPVGLVALPETEYVEIYNVSGSNLFLSGWVFLYDGKETVLPDTVFPAGCYAVLYRSGHDMAVAEGALSLSIDKFPSSLANTGKTVGLKNSEGVLIDEMAYPKAVRGKSYERDGEGLWYLCTDEKGGTPGEANSPALPPDLDPAPEPDPGTDPDPDPAPDPDTGVIIESLEIIINEILPEPFADGSEYIELYNLSGRPLFLSGLAIAVRKEDGTLSTHYPLHAISDALLPGGYVVLTKSYDGVADFYFTSTPENIYEVKLPTLNNDGAAIVLFRLSDEVVIDEVSYSAKWHDASIKNKKGVSLERIHPDEASMNESNWISAAPEAGYGTPGCKNSQYKNGNSGENAFISPPEYVPGFDYYTLAYHTNKSGYRCRVEIYATGGKKIAEISNNQLMVQEGALKWDGRGLDGNRLSPGVYIFYAELYHADGDYHQFKNAFLVK